MIDPTLETRIRSAIHGIPCIESLAIHPTLFEDGLVELSARNNPAWNGRRRGVHGGVLAYLADCVAWFAIVSRLGPETPMATTDLSIRYLAPCLSEELFGRGRVIKFGRTLVPTEVELFDASGQRVAVAQVCYMRLDAETR